MARFHFFRRFILLPSFVGLACCACQPISTMLDTTSSQKDRTADGQTNSSIDQSDAQPVNPSPSAAENTNKIVASHKIEPDPIQSSLAAYKAGLDLASSATKLSQSALSPDDWSLVLSRWQGAAEQLKQVTKNSEKYPSAQQKIADYTRNAQQIQAKIEQLQTEAHVPLAPTPMAPLGAASQSDGTRAKRRVSVPVVRRLHGTPVVQVTFNGNQTYEMILDTGASHTLITRQMASELNIVATEQMSAATASAADVTFDIGQARTISMGSLTLNNVPVSIGDAIDIGLLGNDFFAGYDVIIRSRENVVELVES